MKIHGIELSEDGQRRLLYYVGHHDDQLGMKVHSLWKHLNVASLDEYKLMLQLQLADAKAHIMLPKITERIEACNDLLNGRADELYRQILAEKENIFDE